MKCFIPSELETERGSNVKSIVLNILLFQAPHQEFLGINLEDNASENAETDASMSASWRYTLMLRALLVICGENLNKTLLRQQLLVKVNN